MNEILIRIKRAVIAGNLDFTEKARVELEVNHLLESEVVESLSNADRILKTLKSTSKFRHGHREYL